MKDLFDISGKVALVTGGSRGIGEMIAEGYVANGVKTYISARKADACDATAARLAGKGECFSIPADLSTAAGIDKLVAEISARESRLDILVNNAGANWGEPVETFPEQAWDKVMDINVKSPFFLTRALLPLLTAAADCRGSRASRHGWLYRWYPCQCTADVCLRSQQSSGASPGAHAGGAPGRATHHGKRDCTRTFSQQDDCRHYRGVWRSHHRRNTAQACRPSGRHGWHRHISCVERREFCHRCGDTGRWRDHRRTRYALGPWRRVRTS